MWKISGIVLQFGGHRSERARERPIQDTMALHHLLRPPLQARPGVGVVYRWLRRQDEFDLTVKVKSRDVVYDVVV